MGLLDKIFGRKKQEPQVTRFEMVNDTGTGFYSWNGNIYQSDIVRACIRPKAKAIGKLIGKHLRESLGSLTVNPNTTLRFLLEEPNPFMTGQLMQEKLAFQLELNNNAFAYIQRDEYGNPVEIYPVVCSSVDVVEGVSGDVFLKFHFKRGKTMTVPYVDVIHLRQDYNEDDFFGESPAEALRSLMEVISITDQGLVKAIQNSNIIKWILKFNSVLKKEDMQASVNDFVRNYLSITADTIGAAASDPRYQLEQVKTDSFVPESKVSEIHLTRIYNFFGTNEQIVNGSYSEDQWLSYYESCIEPVAMQLSGEFTRKIFSRKERGFGNRIVFEASHLQYASMKTKMELVQMVDRGAMTPNEWRAILNLAPIEGGEDPIRRLDTAPVFEGGEKNAKSDNANDGTQESTK